MGAPLLEFEGSWEEIRAHDAELAGRRVRLRVLPREMEMSAVALQPALDRAPTVRELMAMPKAERGIILEQQAAIAERLYATIPELTDFEAFGEEDLFDATP